MIFNHTSLTSARTQREVRSVSPAWWICCPFALFINCWIHWHSIGSFSVSCYTATELQPRCHPSFLMGTGDCGAALLPWQQALSHSPHIAWSVHVVPSKLERATAETGLLSQTGPSQGYLPPALMPDALLIPPPTLYFPFSLLLMHSVSQWLLPHSELCTHTWPSCFNISSAIVGTAGKQEADLLTCPTITEMVVLHLPAPVKMSLYETLNPR